MNKYRLKKEFRDNPFPVQIDMTTTAILSDEVVFSGDKIVTTDHDLSHAVGRYLEKIGEENGKSEIEVKEVIEEVVEEKVEDVKIDEDIPAKPKKAVRRRRNPKK